MTEEKLEQATAYLSEVRGAEVALNRLGKYLPNATSFGIKVGVDLIYIENELADQVINLVTDYYEKKKTECQKQFEAL